MGKRGYQTIAMLLTAAMLAACGEEADSGRGRREDAAQTATEEGAGNDAAADGTLDSGSGQETEADQTAQTATDAPEPDHDGEASEVVSASDELQYLKLDQNQILLERYDDETDQLLFMGSYPELLLEDREYAALARQIDALSNDLQLSILSDADEMESYMHAALEADYVYSWLGCTSEYMIQTRRADTQVVSLLGSWYSYYAGGVHPNLEYMTYNYDTQTGEALKLVDVIEDGQEERFAQAVEDIVYTEYGEDVSPDLAEGILETLGMSDVKYTLGYDALTVYFSPYEIAAYAAGDFVIPLPYRSYPGLVREEYLTRPEDYITPVPSQGTYTLADGRQMSYDAQYLETSDDLHIAFNMGNDGAPSEYYFYGYDADVYLAHVGGRDYAYVDTLQDNDYHMIYTFDLSGRDAVNGDDVGGGFYVTPYDPSRIRIHNRGWLLSTYEMWREYHIGEDGQLIPNEDYYYITDRASDRGLRLKQELTVEQRDDFFDTHGETVTLPEGTELWFYATDGDGWVDFTIYDGSFVRIYVETEDYPQSVDGVDIEELFEGLIFAG